MYGLLKDSCMLFPLIPLSFYSPGFLFPFWYWSNQYNQNFIKQFNTDLLLTLLSRKVFMLNHKTTSPVVKLISGWLKSSIQLAMISQQNPTKLFLKLSLSWRLWLNVLPWSGGNKKKLILLLFKVININTIFSDQLNSKKILFELNRDFKKNLDIGDNSMPNKGKT